ncbi:hypothetical protein SFRURICE_015242 [Spodoptera frugiperda]|nr:hypothetical protein SFRURICE_015242 [Spodoptera frugiperda]
MKDTVLLLLCAVALAHSYVHNTQRCNCDPSEARQICESNYGLDDVLVAHEYCDKFYKCANGRPVAYQCPDNLLYDPVAERCEWPNEVNCGNRPISDGNDCNETDVSSSTQEPVSSSSSSTTSRPIDDETCNCRPEEAPSICAADGSDGVLVANENCNQFYICDHGKPVALSCPGNLLYNPYIEQCDWPENVDCGDRVIPDTSQTPPPGPSPDPTTSPTGSPNPTPTPSPSTPGSGTCNCRPEEAPSICAADGSDVLHMRPRKPVALSCPGNLLYNPYIEQCDWPENVDCGDRVIPDTSQTPPPGPSPDPTTSPTGSPNPTPTPSPSTPGSGTCNCRPEEAPSICAADGSDGVLVANENCNQFYICVHGKPVALSCPGNLLYNPYIEQCDWPENVDCGDRVIPDTSQTPPPGPSPDPTTSSTGSPNPTPTPSPSTPGSGTCNCRPEEAPSICAADGSDGVLVANENCNQFYICDHGKPVALSCPGNLLYNPYIEQCDWPENVDCGDRVIPDTSQTPPPGPSPDPTTSSTGSPNPTPTPSPSTPGSGTCNCRPEEAPSICAADGSDGVLVANENCNQFYICDHGKPVALSCPGNLLYNPYIEQCDWPENVDCGDRVIPDTSQTPPPGPSPDPTTSPTGSPNPTPTPSPSTPGSGTCNCRPEEAPSICAADGSDGVLVAMKTATSSTYASTENQLLCPVPETCCTTLTSNNATGQRMLTAETEHKPNSTSRTIPGSNYISNRIPNPTPTPSPSTPGSGTCNCRPEEAPSICAADGSDGVLVANENCNQFYICDHGKPVALSCPGNLLYNPYIEQCDWPENVDCGDRVIPDTSQTPPPGPSPDPTTSPTGSPNPTPTPSPSTPGSGTCNCRPEEAPSICAADGSDGVLVANENCNQFYICDHGKPVALSCPGNLLYNPYIEQCDWPENVDCGDRVIPDTSQTPPPGPSPDPTTSPTGSPNPTPTPSPSTPGSGTCNCRPEEAPSICAADGSDVLHMRPRKTSCSVLSRNLLYNPYIEQCDWPENVDCGDRVIPDTSQTPPPGPSPDPTTSSTGSPNPTPTPSPSTPGSGTCNCRPEEAPSICAADGSDGVLVANENCNQFYICVHGKPVALSCPGNLLYNPYIEQCDWPENVDCGDRVIPDTSQTPPPGPSPDPTTSPTGSPNPTPTPSPSTPGSGTCNCRPEEAPSICAADGSDGVLVANENCNQFYICAYGKPVALSCPGNLLYNPYIEQCDWPENVDCGDRVVPDPSQTPPPGPGSSPNPTPSPTASTPSSGTCNCRPEEAPSICAADGSDGVLVANENCNQFYICAYGKPVALSCPGNLLYNPYIEQCDWPENVDCGIEE